MTTPPLVVTASPHLKGPASTLVIMWTVVASMLPLVAMAAYAFGISALLVVAAAAAGALGAEALLGKAGAWRDGSALITGVLLGLTLPAGLPLWMAVLGGAVAIGLGKQIFGGLGYNIFNPALLGRAFLQAAFPLPMTTWPVRSSDFWTLAGNTFAVPLMRGSTVDVLTAATPLGLRKFEHTEIAIDALVFGARGGSLGETFALVILACGAYLAWRRFLNWRTPVSILGTVAVLSFALQQVDATFPGPLFMVFSGGLMLGAIYMATDMVTSPVTNNGRWIFGAGIGVLVVVIRVWGGLPEGVMYAILLMNATVPAINRATQPRVFGHVAHRGRGAAA